MAQAHEQRRQRAIDRYLAGDPIEDICRELACAKSWLYKWRERYLATDPSWSPTLTAPGTSERRGEEQLCGISRSYWFWLSIHPLKCLDTWKSEIGLTDQI